MASLFRRGGAELAKVIQQAGDPAAITGVAQLYSKAVAGAAELFMRSGLAAATISQVAGLAAPLTTGSIPFSNSSGQLAQDNANFFWDDTNNRLIVGGVTSLTSHRATLINNVTVEGVLAIQNLSATGFSSISCFDEVGVTKLGIGYDNTSNQNFVEFSGASIDFHDDATDPGALGDIYLMMPSGAFQFTRSNAPVVAPATSARLAVISSALHLSNNAGAYAPLVTGPAAAGFTVGSVAFGVTGGGLGQDNANFFWEDTTNVLRLGGTVTSGDVGYRLGIKNGGSGTNVMLLQNTSTDGFASINFTNTAGTFVTGFGFGNSTVTPIHVRSLQYLYSDSQDFVFANASRNEIRMGMISGSAFIELANGSGAAVSTASTGKLRYNTTGQKAQWSFNGAAYFDAATYATALTAGSVVFANASNQLAQDNANFFWDDTNNRLGIGNAAPAQALHVTGTGRFTAGILLDTLTTGSIVFSGASGALSQDNANLFWDDTNNRLGVNDNTPSDAVDVTGSVNSTVSYKQGGTKVVGAQGAAVADAAGGANIDAEARTAINDLLARLRASTGHGLIA